MQKVSFPLKLSIHIPADDLSYYKKSLYSINQLPSNIKLLIAGMAAIVSDKIVKILDCILKKSRISIKMY